MANALEKAFERAATECDNACTLALLQAHAKYLVPFCNKKNLRFTAGMGCFIFTDEKGEEFGENIWSTDHSGIPKRLLGVLLAEWPLNRGQTAGSMMPSYTPPNFKA